MAPDFAQRVSVTTADGVALSVAVLRPRGEPLATVLAGHAMMANVRSLDRPLGGGFLSFLAGQGFLVLGADLRGHGRSGTPVSRGGNWTYDDIVDQDVPALLGLARQVAPGSKLVLVGHSLFAHATTAWLGLHPDEPVQALVSVSANLWMRRDEPDRVRRVQKDLRIALVWAIHRLFGHFPARRLRMGSDDEASGYIRQFLDFYRQSRWASADGAIDYLRATANIRLPMLVVTGKGDTLWCTAESVRRFHGHIPASSATYWRVGRGDFGLTFDPGHMDVLTDPRSWPLWKAMADWICSRL